MYYIYMHTNKINNKRYVGQTKQKVEDRWRSNGFGYNDQPKFYSAIKKYGWNNFKHCILEKIDTDDVTLVNEREKYYIKKYDCIDNGYNVSDGGVGNIPRQCKEVYQIDPRTLKVVAKFKSIAEAQRVTGIGAGSACRRVVTFAGGYMWSFAKDYSENWQPLKTNHRKRIVQISPVTLQPINIFNSMKEAEEITGFSRGTIRCCVLKKTNTSCGYYWCTYDEFVNGWKPPKISNFCGLRFEIEVYDYSNKFLFKETSLSNLSKRLNIPTSSLSRYVSKGEYKDIYKFKKVYNENYLELKNQQKGNRIICQC